MNKLTCAIVEDDTFSLTIVEALAEKTKMLDIRGKFSSPGEAIPWLVKNEVELLFLDVEMPEMTGLEMLRVLPYQPDVIVISSKPDYAVEAYDLTVMDYLLKPIKDYNRFLLAVNKVITKRKTHAVDTIKNETLFVKIDSLLLNLDTNNIELVEAFGDYIKIHESAKIHTIYSTLKKIEDKLDSNKFVRVHRSYIVNISKITNIDPNNLVINKKIIPISGTYREMLMSRISIL